MGQKDQVQVKRADDLTPLAKTPGIERLGAFSTERAVIVRAKAEPGVSSGWHTHGDREVLGMLLSGAARFEYGEAGNLTEHIAPGDFIRVPPGLVHRDLNPDEKRAQDWLLVFVGEGPLVVNLGGPPGR